MPNKVLEDKKDQNRKDLKKGLKGNDVESAQSDKRGEELEIPPEVGEVSTEKIAKDSLRDEDNRRFFRMHKNKYKPIDINEYAGDAVEEDLDEEDTESPAV